MDAIKHIAITRNRILVVFNALDYDRTFGLLEAVPAKLFITARDRAYFAEFEALGTAYGKGEVQRMSDVVIYRNKPVVQSKTVLSIMFG